MKRWLSFVLALRFTLSAFGNVPAAYPRGLDLSGTRQRAGGIGGLLAMTEGSGTSSYFHADALGNVTALMDASENIVARRMYDAFGRTIRLTGRTGINPFWFSGQLHDEDTDIYSYLYRSYTPSIPGRWLSPDPLGEPGFELIRHRKANALAGGPNRYNFVANNPVNRIDPLGLWGADPYTLPPQDGTQINRVPAISIDPYTGVVSNNDSPKEVALMMGLAALADLLAAAYIAPEAALAALGQLGHQKPDPCKDKIPQKALDVLKYIEEHGEPPPGYVGEREFGNNEGLLPPNGDYREYDVDPKPPAGTSRNAERIVVDQNTGRAWYTDDHYQSFTEIDE